MPGEDKPWECPLGMVSFICEHYPNQGDWVEVGTRPVWVCSVPQCNRVMQLFSANQQTDQHNDSK